MSSYCSINSFFTQERRNVKIIQQSAGSSQNPYLLSEQEEITTLKKHQENKTRLRVPRRPAWTKSMTPAELEKQEKTAFLDWRRGLARYVPLQHDYKILKDFSAFRKKTNFS